MFIHFVYRHMKFGLGVCNFTNKELYQKKIFKDFAHNFLVVTF